MGCYDKHNTLFLLDLCENVVIFGNCEKLLNMLKFLPKYAIIESGTGENFMNKNHRNTIGLDEREQQLYFKELMTFSVPNQNDKRIGKNIPALDEFDLVDERRINGHLQKRFVRLHKAYFADVLKQIGKKECFYHAHITPEDVKTNSVPRNLSVLIKEIGHEHSLIAEVEHQKMYAEAVCSRVLNFFGCKTVYNKVLNTQGTLFVLSLDFLRPYEHFYVAEDICEKNEIWCSNPLENSLASVDMDIDILKHRVENEFGVSGVAADKEQIKRDYVMSYLVRVFLLGDTDFRSRNYGFIYNIQDNEIYSAPDYDFELAFGMSTKRFAAFEQNFKAISEKYPDILEEFLKKAQQLTKNNIFGYSKFDKIFVEETAENDYVMHFRSMVPENVSYMVDYAKKNNVYSGSRGLF